MHINSNQVNVHSSIVASYRTKRESKSERGGERRRRMLAIICIVPSRQVWVCEELSGCCYHWDVRSLSLFRLLLCVRVSKKWIDERKWGIRLKHTAMSSLLHIREECFLSFFFGYQSMTIDEQSSTLLLCMYTIYYYSGTLLCSAWTF